jgi:hypothetical protein
MSDFPRADLVTICRGAAMELFQSALAQVNNNIKDPNTSFRELDQPASDFIFRVKNGGGFALFEADGGAWKIAAINAIAAWLKNRLHTSEVEQLDTLPIIS